MNIIYQVIKADKATYTQAHVKELNANIATGTFKGYGNQLADLYSSKNSCAVLVAHKSCPPVNDTFVKTVMITI